MDYPREKRPTSTKVQFRQGPIEAKPTTIKDPNSIKQLCRQGSISTGIYLNGDLSQWGSISTRGARHGSWI